MLGSATHDFLTALAGRPPVDEALWLEALTHGSTGAPRDYQRLEFLGDRVLGMVIGAPVLAACVKSIAAIRALRAQNTS